MMNDNKTKLTSVAIGLWACCTCASAAAIDSAMYTNTDLNIGGPYENSLTVQNEAAPQTTMISAVAPITLATNASLAQANQDVGGFKVATYLQEASAVLDLLKSKTPAQDATAYHTSSANILKIEEEEQAAENKALENVNKKQDFVTNPLSLIDTNAYIMAAVQVYGRGKDWLRPPPDTVGVDETIGNAQGINPDGTVDQAGVHTEDSDSDITAENDAIQASEDSDTASLSTEGTTVSGNMSAATTAAIDTEEGISVAGGVSGETIEGVSVATEVLGDLGDA